MIVDQILPRHLLPGAAAPGQYITSRGVECVRGLSVRGRHGSRAGSWYLRREGRTEWLGDVEIVSLEEARSMARQRLREWAGLPPAPPTHRVSDLWGRIRRDHESRVEAGDLRRSTADGYARLWSKEILRRWGRSPVENVSAEAIASWRHEYATRPVLWNRLAQQIRTALRAARSWGWIDAVPEVPTYGESRGGRALSGEEISSLLRAADRLASSGRVPQAAADATWALLFSGARPGELLEARREWCRWEGDVLVVCLPRAKGDRPGRRRGREVRIPPPASTRLRHGDGPLLIPGVSPGSPLRLRRYFKRICRAAGLEGVTPRTLRHAWRSVAAETGAPRDLVRVLGGWTNDRMGERYTHGRSPALNRAAAIVAAKITPEARKVK